MSCISVTRVCREKGDEQIVIKCVSVMIRFTFNGPQMGGNVILGCIGKYHVF